ncbi:MAG TPA: tRNA (adenosine(37)-N6)-threonylcarbamoyltransferase complex ATPase subunit type 1 TsaE [Bryobacteraceae bacterium]|nr:tRNA (adenosine(37)-N6)-threonylcarbamoyltransferase complex ATPase subunit type 1 TsaE [Bryobacteraceae bacterium]
MFRTRSEEETVAAGEEIGRGLTPGSVVLLIGELGAGKTTLAKGIVKGLGAGQPDDVSSPTFTLIQEYGEATKVYHIDLFRIESAREAEELGLEELLSRPGVVLVEWGERFPQLWPAERIEIRLRELKDGSREIRCS